MNVAECSKETELQCVPARVTFYVKSDKDTVDCTVHGWKPDVAAEQVVDATKDYVLTQVVRAMVLRGEKLERWWAEDEFGNIVESHQKFTPRPSRRRRT